MHPARRSLLISPHVDFEAIQRSEAQIREAKKSPNTRATYFWAWRAFLSWCEAAQVSPLPAEPRVVKNFATWCLEQGYRINTVTLRLAAIASCHREAGFPSPLGSEIWRHVENVRRHFREAPGGKKAITCEMLRKMMRRAFRR